MTPRAWLVLVTLPACLEREPSFVDPRGALLVEWPLAERSTGVVLDTTRNGFDLDLDGATWHDGGTMFDGVDDIGRGPDLRNVWPGIATFTLEARVRILDTTSDWNARAIVYVPQESDSGYYGTGLVVNTAGRRFRFESVLGTKHTYIERDQLYGDAWVTVHGVYDGSQMHLYVDGEEPVDPIPATGVLADASVAFGEQRITVAGRANGDERLGCEIASLRVYTRALSAAEVDYRHQQLSGD